MFDFIRKELVWSALDKGYLEELSTKLSYQLKTAQDLAVYSRLRDKSGLVIGEIGGGDFRILLRLAKRNRCYNIEKFEGADGGPKSEIVIPGVTNIRAFVGEFDANLSSDFFDVAFSVSVVEHVVTPNLDAFQKDLLRVLKPGGVFLHAIDVYLPNEPTPYWSERFAAYKAWFDDPAVEPLGPIYGGPLKFSCDMASNPDNIMHGWNRIAPSLAGLRKQAQCVSLLVSGRKRALPQ